MATPRPRIDLLGGFRMVAGNEMLSDGSSARRLLALLALNRRPMAREQVVTTLWPDVADANANGRLRTALWRLGSARERLVRIEGDHLELAGRCEVDLRLAENLGRRLLAGEVVPGDRETVVEVFSHDLLPDWDEPWVDSERECFRETRVHVLEALAARFLDLDDQLLAIRASLKAIECSPYRDTSHRLLVRAYREEGNWLTALRHVLRYRQHLGEELNLPPERVLADLFDELAGWAPAELSPRLISVAPRLG